jgi:phage terminase large subunit
MNVEAKIQLARFEPRDYQIPIGDALLNKGYKKIVVVAPRRMGKDILCWNLMLRQALTRIGSYYYFLPTYSQARKVIFDSITSGGVKFLDYIPESLIESVNSQMMKITLINGSIIQLVGSDSYDAIVGSNPVGVVFSEAALSDPRAYQFIRPILAANGGWCIFISTPRGRNWFYELYQIAQNTPDWFAYHLTLDDTQHIPLKEIEKDRAEGIMSEDLILQEYFCDFNLGIEGSIYGKSIDKIKLESRIGDVPWEVSHKVHVSFDLGVRDATSLIFFQVIGQVVRIIDCYENTGHGLQHYAKILQEKPYIYGKLIAPHDIRVRELGTGVSRLETARKMGMSFTIAPDLSIVDGIEASRSLLQSKVWMDERKCASLIKALENYRYEYDAKKKVYKSTPLHDWSSNFADSFRYLSISLPKTRDGASPADIDRNYRESFGGNQSHLPSVFRDDLPNY